MKSCCATIFLFALWAVGSKAQSDELFIADFTSKSGVAGGLDGQAGDANAWREVSDTVRQEGTSKAALVVQDTQQYSRAVFFSVLNPLDNTACFAGMTFTPDPALDISAFSTISIRGRARGNVQNIKIEFRDTQLEAEADEGDFESKFVLDLVGVDLQEYEVSLSDLIYEYRGAEDPLYRPIDLSQITEIGIQVFGGVYDDDIEQSGATAFEIDWIKAKN